MKPSKLNINSSTNELVIEAHRGNSRAENILVKKYAGFINFMVNKYKNKTEIKDRDDLKSAIYLGFLYGIRKFDIKKDVKFMYFCSIWIKKYIYVEEIDYRFIKLPINQKIFYKEFIEFNKKNPNKRQSEKNTYKYLIIEETNTIHFSDLTVFDEDSNTTILPESILKTEEKDPHIKEIENKISLKALKQNINNVLKMFNDKEVFIIKHSFGLDGKNKLSQEEIAVKLNVTEVNIAFTKTKIIKLLRHSSLSNQILEGI